MADAGLLRQENTALLRRAMQDGVFSKNELARQTGLSFPTVGRIIDDMVERGEAREAGVAASTGGRCAMRYELDMHYRLFLCLRLEQDHHASALHAQKLGPMNRQHAMPRGVEGARACAIQLPLRSLEFSKNSRITSFALNP